METMQTNMNPVNPAPADGCLDWNATLTDDVPEFIIPPEGDYLFQVIDFEYGRHNGGGKLPACNKMTVILELQTPERPCRLRKDFFLHTSIQWRLTAFFCAIGLKKRGEDLVMNWDETRGKWGRCHVKPRVYIPADGEERTVTDITRFYDYDPKKVIPPCTDVTGQVDDLPY